MHEVRPADMQVVFEQAALFLHRYFLTGLTNVGTFMGALLVNS